MVNKYVSGTHVCVRSWIERDSYILCRKTKQTLTTAGKKDVCPVLEKESREKKKKRIRSLMHSPQLKDAPKSSSLNINPQQVHFRTRHRSSHLSPNLSCSRHQDALALSSSCSVDSAACVSEDDGGGAGTVTPQSLAGAAWGLPACRFCLR